MRNGTTRGVQRPTQVDVSRWAEEGSAVLNEQEKDVGIDVGEDIGFERREWKMERAAWLVMLVVVLAAVGGLFGNGLFSGTTRTSADGRLEIGYQRFARNASETTLKMSVSRALTTDEGELTILVSSTYLRRFVIRAVTPEPDSVEAVGDSLAYVFKLTAGTPRFEADFELEPRSTGWVRGTVGLEGRAPVRLSQFVYP